VMFPPRSDPMESAHQNVIVFIPLKLGIIK